MDETEPSTSLVKPEEKFSWPFAIKSLIGITSVGGCAFSYKLYRQAMAPENKNIPRAQVFNGVTLASKALVIASISTVSCFGLFIFGISTLLQVSTPKEFGSKMTSLFGDHFRISKNKKSEKSYNSLTELFEDVSTKDPNPITKD
uniref:Transmembrane protein 242 n=1 Tax=Acrobeloides nanus TaxID=290746 RepID=A0A914DJ06_9BILA